MIRVTDFFIRTTLGAMTLFSLSCLIADEVALQIDVGTGKFSLYHQGYIQPSYDEKSMINKITYFTHDTRAYSNQIWTYNSSGDVEKKLYREDLNKYFATMSFQYTYGSNHQVFEEKETIRTLYQRTLQYHYELDKLKGVVSYLKDSDNTPQESLMIDYNEQGLFDKGTLYDKQGIVTLHYQWRYDLMGRVVAKCTYDRNLCLLGYVYIEYDFETNQDLEITFDSQNRPIFNTLILKDDQGRVIEKATYDADGAWFEATLFAYNEAGKIDLIRDLGKDEQGNPMVIGYIATSFDQEGREALTEYQYLDSERLIKQIAPYLQLPGNALITPIWELASR